MNACTDILLEASRRARERAVVAQDLQVWQLTPILTIECSQEAFAYRGGCPLSPFPLRDTVQCLSSTPT